VSAGESEWKTRPQFFVSAKPPASYCRSVKVA
jgi:hypothetical protein